MSEQTALPPTVQHRLRPDVMGTSALAFTVVATVGPMAVFMGAAPLVFMSAGAGASGVYLLATALVAVFAVGYLAMVRRSANASGFILFISQGLGRVAGVAAAITTLITYLVLMAALYGVYTVFVQQTLAGLIGFDVPWPLVALVLLAISTVLAYNRVEFSVRLMGVLLVLAVVSILMVDVAVVARGGADGTLSWIGFLPQQIVTPGFGLAALFALGSFAGVEATAVFSEEAREPRRTVPRAMYAAIALLGLFYVFSTWAIANAVGEDAVFAAANADPTGFILAVAAEYVGPAWVQVLNVLVVTSFVAVVLGLTNVANRYVFAIGRAGLLPRAIGRSHPRHQSPHRASLLTAAVTLVIIGSFILAGADPYGQMYVWLLAIGTVGILALMCATSLAAVFALRRHRAADENLWSALIAPAVSFVGFGVAIVAAIANFGLLAGGGGVVEWLWVVLVAGALVGVTLGLLPRFRGVRFDAID